MPRNKLANRCRRRHHSLQPWPGLPKIEKRRSNDPCTTIRLFFSRSLEIDPHLRELNSKILEL